MNMIEKLKKLSKNMTEEELAEQIHLMRNRRSINANQPRATRGRKASKEPKTTSIEKQINKLDKSQLESLLAMLEDEE